MKNLNILNSSDRMSLTLISSNCFLVANEHGQSFDPPKSGLVGMIETIRQEFSWIDISHLDLEGKDSIAEGALISNYISLLYRPSEIVIRNNRWYRRKLVTVDFNKSSVEKRISLKKEGLYVITGGLGAIGQQVAKFLLEKYNAKILLLGRIDIDNSSSDKAITYKKSLDALIEKSSYVAYESVDITNSEELLNLIEKTENDWGSQLSGVFHLAGIYKESSILNETWRNFNKILSPKLEGGIAINELLEKKKNASVFYFSSVNAVFGGVNVAAYSSANSYLQGLATYQNSRGNVRAYHLMWSAWNIGMNSNKDSSLLAAAKGFDTISADQGVNYLEQILNSNQREVLVGLDGRNVNINVLINKAHKDKFDLLYESNEIKYPTRYKRTSEDGELVGGDILILYYQSAEIISDEDWLKFLKGKLRDHEMPLVFKHVDKIPDSKDSIITSGFFSEEKIEKGDISNNEQKLITIWSNLLEINEHQIGQHDNFFDLGGSSILAIKLKSLIEKEFSLQNFTITNLFKYPTIKELGGFLNKGRMLTEKSENVETIITEKKSSATANNQKIAIISMSASFSGQDSLNNYWEMISEGKIGIEKWDNETCLKNGIDIKRVKNPDFIPCAGRLSSIDKFDPAFWGIAVNDAILMDPQIRKFIEHSWIILEKSGYIKERSKKKIGVFAGVGNDYYYDSRIRNNSEFVSDTVNWEIQSLRSKDYLATRTSYLLGLTGASFSVNTACSSSLVALVEACKNLYLGSCDMAIAGGVSLFMPEDHGYIYKEGMIFSKTGECRPFDVEASGTVGGEGIGVVLLKRLEDAIKDGDQIEAVISGYSINNDGNRKVGYTAPSILAQTECIIDAQKMANCEPNEISYVECHGTGTKLGDPVELMALYDAFSRNADEKFSCYLGAVKSNIGHTDTAAGIAGLIKVCLMIKHGCIPPQINYSTPNPEIKLGENNFKITKSKLKWEGYKKAGVSSFGIGGTNAHVIIEEYQTANGSTVNFTKTNVNQDGMYYLPISAKSVGSVKRYATNLHDWLSSKTDVSLSAIASTLQLKREEFPYRSCIVCSNIENAKLKLKELSSSVVSVIVERPSTVFMFPGQGSQYIQMAKELYEKSLLFKTTMDKCFLILDKLKGESYKNILYPQGNLGNSKINLTTHAQPTLFIVSYSLAKCFEEKGIIPKAFIGHSIGELVAATLSGVIKLDEALEIIVERGRLMQLMNQGKMLSINENINVVERLLNQFNLEINVHNSPEMTVVGGDEKEINRFYEYLKSINIQASVLHTSHAFHTKAMNDAANEFEIFLRKFKLCDPKIPFISNVTGEFITNDQAKSSVYWANQIRSTVKFSKGIESIYEKFGKLILIEVGPGKSLTSFVHQHKKPNLRPISSLPNANAYLENNVCSYEFFCDCVSKFWENGGVVDWENLSDISPDNTPLGNDFPTYDFEKVRCWIDTRQSVRFNISEESISQTKVENDSSEKKASIVSHLQKLFLEILGNSNIDIHDNFFEVGGTSLSAIRLVNKINNKLLIDIKTKDFFEHNTILKLAHFIEKSKNDNNFEGYLIQDIDLDKDENFLPFPLNNLQQAYYLGAISSNSNNSPTGNTYSEYKFGFLDLAKLNQSFCQLIKRHLALRTIFTAETQQYLKEVPEYKIEYKEFISEESFLSFRNEIIKTKFDSSCFPMFKIAVSKLPEYYVLHICFDVLLVDGNSFAILMNEWTRLYNLPDVTLPALNITYKNYMTQYQKIRKGPLFEKARKYWLNKVEDYDFRLNIPYMNNFSSVNKVNFKQLKKVIPWNKWNIILDKSKKLRIGPTSVLLEIFGRVLTHWTGQDRVTINMTLFNRLPLHSQVNDIVGDFTILELFNFMNDRGGTINERLLNTHNILWEDINYSLFDGVDFQRLIRKERQLSGDYILAPVTFTSILEERDENQKNSKFLDESYQSKLFSLTQTAHVFLDNVVYTNDEGIVIEWNYVDQLFDSSTISHMHESYVSIIEKLLDLDWESSILPSCVLPINDLTVIGKGNSDKRNYPKTTMYQEFDLRVKEVPDNIAVIDEGIKRSFTYFELQINSIKLASYLSTLGTKSIIGILSEKGYHQVLGTMGILRSGNGYLPLNIDWPIDRMIGILHQAGVKDMLLSKAQSLRLDLAQLKDLFNLVVIEEDINNRKYCETVQEADLPKVDPSDVAYVIFTSGTTGKPKGVTIDHIGAMNTIYAVNDEFSVSEKDCVLALSDLSFDLSVYDIYGPLSRGGKIVFPEQSKVKDPENWRGLVEKHNITIWNSVPQLADLLIDASTDELGTSLSSIRLYLLSGDKIPVELPNLLKKCSSSATVISLGGATEGSIWSIWYKIGLVDPSWTSIPYGIAMPNQNMYVLNSQLKHCPVGVLGEIYIGGIGVAKNYWNDPLKTEERFKFHPELGKIYATGDLGSWHEKGYIEFVGRKDSQVKIRGNRVELGEIQSVLNEIDTIKDSLIQYQSDSKFLVAYYVKNSCDQPPKTESYVDKWISIYNEEYANLDISNFKENIEGWISSFTNNPIPKNDMLEWASNTVDRILGMSPRSILEIGSGSGLLLFNLVDHVDHYYATDFSSTVIDYTEKVAKLQNIKEKVQAIACAADSIPYDNFQENYDTVICNSVTQHFPDVDYLENVILTSIDNLQGSGNVFFGDNRDYRLLRCFHYAVQRYHNPNTTKEDVEYFISRDKELLISPQFFWQVYKKHQRISGVQIMPKLGTADHEMNRYRYDVIFDVNGKDKVEICQSEIKMTDKIFREIDNFEGTTYNAFKYPIKRIYHEFMACEQFFGNDVVENGLFPNEIASIPEIIDYCKSKKIKVQFFLDLNSENYLFVVLQPEGMTENDVMINYDLVVEKCASKLSTNPLKIDKDIKDEFIKGIKNRLSSKLPDYMVPDHFIELESMPLTANGKIDVKRLPIPSIKNISHKTVAPRNEFEREMCEIWTEALGLNTGTVGVEDDFFALGGNSITIIQMRNAIRKRFKKEIGLRDVFQFRTIAAFCERFFYDFNDDFKDEGKRDIWFKVLEELKNSSFPQFQAKRYNDRLLLTHELGVTLKKIRMVGKKVFKIHQSELMLCVFLLALTEKFNFNNKVGVLCSLNIDDINKLFLILAQVDASDSENSVLSLKRKIKEAVKIDAKSTDGFLKEKELPRIIYSYGINLQSTSISNDSLIALSIVEKDGKLISNLRSSLSEKEGFDLLNTIELKLEELVSLLSRREKKYLTVNDLSEWQE